MPAIVVAPAMPTAISAHGRVSSPFFVRMIDFGSATRDVEEIDGRGAWEAVGRSLAGEVLVSAVVVEVVADVVDVVVGLLVVVGDCTITEPTIAAPCTRQW